ncbi:HpcH/HpaI aldolase/citrate lyase family protein [Polymorphum gilvum]|uniref:Citrate lyase, beta subunit protein n=1 Tax=Polymorphum gilvum (strain LMG 25793 / CGMCC 1.9160 / SL003B-26A1) TaxID=991905 RepID=F2IYP9_POLGS|nr:CoA ester lyase [Polymorphum gilvum]ADZ69496.1 Citrate lyase, beta subunit protein [Polymorphum gilvum SL003B-26A1]
MRSLLFVPGVSAKMMAKAADCAADVVILDLEDAVQPQAKAEARALVAGHLAARPADRRPDGPRIAVRVNGLDTPWCAADVAAVVPHAPDLLMLPKATGPQDVARLAGLLAPFESDPGRTGILVVATETAEATVSLLTRSWAHPRLRGLLWGGEDLSVDLGATANRDEAGAYTEPFRMARNFCLYGARLAGVPAIDAVYTDFRDTGGLRRETEAARRDGFAAKAAIHPAQIGAINAVFTPAEADLAWARAVVDALAVSSTGVAVVDGQMVDAPHLARARRLLDAAR